MASTLVNIDIREVIHQSESIFIVEEEKMPEESWIAPLLKYLQEGTLPDDSIRAQKLKKRAPRFTLLNEKLYQRSFQGPLLKCLADSEVYYVIREIHEGCCRDHGGILSLARRTLLAGYWWPTQQQDAQNLVRKCEGCQRFGNFSHKPAAELQMILTSCHFDQWGMDIVGPLPLAPDRRNSC